jgi:cell division protein FtsB
MTQPPSPNTRDGFLRGHPAGSVLARHSLGILVGSGLLMMLVLSQLSENGVVSWFNLTARKQQLEQETADLAERNRELAARLDALRNDPAALEKIAREDQNMRRPEEEVLMVLNPEETSR